MDASSKLGSASKKRKHSLSLSPRRGKRKVSGDEVKRHVDAAKQRRGRSDPGASTSTQKAPQSLKSLFAKAKPPQYTVCPVCGEQVKLSEINNHLDAGCLAVHCSPGKGVQQSSEFEAVSSSSAKALSSPQNSRKIADLRVDAKDKRTRRRLQDKFESSPLYQLSSSSSSSSTCQELSLRRTQSVPVNDSESQIQLLEKSLSETIDQQTGSVCSTFINQTAGKLEDSDDFVDTSMQRSTPILDSVDNRVPVLNLVSSEANYAFHPSKSGSCTQLSFKKSSKCSKSSTSVVCVDSGDGQEKTDNMAKTSPYFDTAGGDVSRSKGHSRLSLRKSHTVSETSASVCVNSADCQEKAGHVAEAPAYFNTNGDDLSRSKGRSRLSLKKSHTVNKSSMSVVCVDSVADGDDAVGDTFPTSTPPNQVQHMQSLPTTPTVLGSKRPGWPALNQSKSLPNSPAGSLGPPVIRRSTSLSPGRIYIPSRKSPAKSEGLGSPHKPKDPYYIRNFKLILNVVLKNEFDVHLFNDEDHAQVSKFNCLSGPAQQLYVRLFQRKYAWIRAAKIEYPKIASDVGPLLLEMNKAGLLIAEDALDDLGQTLKLMMAPDLKQLAKDLKVGGASGQKSELVTAIVKYSSSQRSIFASNMNHIVLKKAKKMLGQCIRLAKEPRVVFNRIILLFSLVRQDLIEEEKGSAGQTALQTELLVNMGWTSYPAYVVHRTRSFFLKRQDLLAYEVALQYENDIHDALGINDFELADRLQSSATETFQKLMDDDEDTRRHDESLPDFMRYYTAGWVFTRVLHLGVEIKQKQRCYEEAIAILHLLLQQNIYCMDRRGAWWDRLALNLDQHCRKPNECLDSIKEGLADPYVRTGHRLALQQRAQKMLKSRSKKKLADRTGEFQFDDVKELPKVTIQGCVLPYNGPGVKTTFISSYQGTSKSDEGIMVCGVEQVALDHYKQQGYTEGLHGEGSTYTTLVFILFWDIVFQSHIPDVFCYPYQSAPLDLRTDQFFSNRYDAIQQKLREIREASTDQLEAMLKINWLEYEGDLCVGVSWELFRNVKHATGLLDCIGGAVLSAISERILRDHRHCRGGLPDLTMWNPETQKFRVVEVKGPGDRLSHKQILWLDFFLSLGVDAEVCHVEAVGSKRLKKKVPASQESSTSHESRTSQE